MFFKTTKNGLNENQSSPVKRIDGLGQKSNWEMYSVR